MSVAVYSRSGAFPAQTSNQIRNHPYFKTSRINRMEHVHKPSSDDAASSPKMESILEDHVRRPYFSSNAQLQLSWQRLQEVPSGHEILSAIDERTLPHNIVDGAWGSKVDYVRTQYRLLRFDAIRALQDSVAEFSTAPNLGDTRNTCIYTHVGIRIPAWSFQLLTHLPGLHCWLHVQPDRRSSSHRVLYRESRKAHSLGAVEKVAARHARCSQPCQRLLQNNLPRCDCSCASIS